MAKDKPTANEARRQERAMEMTHNAVMFRREFLSKLVDPKRDIDKECGYPDQIDPSHYEGAWERNGIASRVISVFPEESWKLNPDVYEDEKGDPTDFEKEIDRLEDKFGLFSFLERIDTLSGIGHYGVLLIGINDGKELDQPIDGIDETGEMTPKRPKGVKLTYLRCFDERLAPIEKLVDDPTNPRFGQPEYYTLKFSDVRNNGFVTSGTATLTDKRVHWSRILHVADNRTTSEVIGTPRLKNVFNYLYDLRKILSGSGEMFWKGGFPGYSFEVAPENVGQIEIDKDSMRKEMEAFSNSLQRYMALVGVTAKSLAPQVADPRPHFEVQLDAVCISKAIPKRIFMGSEQAQLASTQDKKTWNERLAHRQVRYLTPMLVRPFFDRLIAIGVLPQPKQFYVAWPEIFGPTDDEIATTAFKQTQAMAAYVGSGSENLMPPMEYFTLIHKFTSEEATAIIKAAESHTAMFDDLLDKGNPQEAPSKEVDRGKKATKPAGA